MNGIYDLFGLANDSRTDNYTQPQKIIYGQPSFLERAVSTVDFTDGLPPTEILRNKEEQTRHSALSSQIFTNSIANTSNFAFLARIFDEFFSGFRAKFQKRVTPFAFSIKFAKTN